MEVWINDDILNKWKALPSGRPGAQPIYSDLAIQIVLQVGKVFHQKLRQTEGLLENIFRLTKVKLSVPDYSTVSRRGLPVRRTQTGANLNILLRKKAKK